MHLLDERPQPNAMQWPEQAAEKVDVEVFGRGAASAAPMQVLHFCHSERASAREESAFPSFQQTLQPKIPRR
jgi:hypothetical protein